MESGRGEIADVISVGSMVLLSAEEARGYKGSIFTALFHFGWNNKLEINIFLTEVLQLADIVCKITNKHPFLQCLLCQSAFQ